MPVSEKVPPKHAGAAPAHRRHLSGDPWLAVSLDSFQFLREADNLHLCLEPLDF